MVELQAYVAGETGSLGEQIRNVCHKDIQSEAKDDEKKVSERKIDQRLGEDGRLAVGTDVTLDVRTRLDEYIADIEFWTKRVMKDKQRTLITNYIMTNPVFKVDKRTHDRNRSDFSRKKRMLRKQWSMETGQEWPTYQQPVISTNGRVLRAVGQLYDAHHIIEVGFDGPNKWWNLFPAAYPNEHQNGIHDDRSVGTEIFGPINREFHEKTKNTAKVVEKVKEVAEKVVEVKNEVRKKLTKKQKRRLARLKNKNIVLKEDKEDQNEEDGLATYFNKVVKLGKGLKKILTRK